LTMCSPTSMCSLVLAALLFVSAVVAHDHDHDHDHDEKAIKSTDHQYVTCGSMVKLKHVDTESRLHSHEITYGSGSGQQSVTGQPNRDDDGSYWLLKEAYGSPVCAVGDKFKRGDSFRLHHLATGRYLHSHQHASPLSRQQEVSCFGESGRGDRGDNWIVVPSGNEVYWLRGERVRIVHKDTQFLLDISDQVFRNPIPGQREVVCTSRVTPTDPSPSKAFWIAEEGIYMPQTKKN